LELLRYLLERFSVEEIEHWAGLTSIWGVAARAIDRPPPLVSARHLAARRKVDVETVMEMRRALGFPVDDPDAPTIPQFAADDLTAFLLGCELFGREETLALTRVIGWAGARVAEAARAAFGNHIAKMEPESRSELEMARANEAGAVAWIQAQSVMAHVMAEHPLRNITFVEALMAGDLCVALAFIDLVSSTEWAESLGADQRSDALRRFEMEASAIALAQGARLVKLIGDEAMLVAEDPAALCSAAVAVCEMADADPVLPAARGAIGFGYVTARDGDYFGPLVNTVARATKVADPGSIVATVEVARTLDPARWSTEPLGATELRGVGQEVHLSRVVRTHPRPRGGHGRSP
jgi:adenylate cyclase